MKKLSVTVITKNEEDNIARCLESVAFADEIVVFDSGSTDRTVEIAKHYTPRVESTDWPGHVKQKQRAVDAASNDWILAVDADEVVSPPLAASIKNALASGDAVAYELTRKVFTSGNGSTIAVGIRNGEYAFSTGAKPSGAATIRTTVWNAPDGSAVCPGDLEHYSYRDLSHHLARINEYTTIMAREYKAKGRRSGLADLIFRPPWTFFKKYLLQRGILDGSAGFVICVLASYYVFLKYAKLREFGRADG